MLECVYSVEVHFISAVFFLAFENPQGGNQFFCFASAPSICPLGCV